MFLTFSASRVTNFTFSPFFFVLYCHVVLFFRQVMQESNILTNICDAFLLRVADTMHFVMPLEDNLRCKKKWSRWDRVKYGRNTTLYDNLFRRHQRGQNATTFTTKSRINSFKWFSSLLWKIHIHLMSMLPKTGKKVRKSFSTIRPIYSLSYTYW